MVEQAPAPKPTLEPELDDEQSLFWEQRMGVTGVQ
jgi:hypothetical protein